MEKNRVAIRLYNILTRRKEIFKPIRKDRVGFYACGPTVYNFAHIGNLRTYLFEDIVRRILVYAGYKVYHIMNITDVDDKIIREALAARQPIDQFVKPYEQAFFSDVQKLHIVPAEKYPKATEHIPEMIRLIEKLLKKGVAYRMDGSVYFAVGKFPSYGMLSQLQKRMLKPGARVDVDEYTKKDVQDFVLWKSKKRGEPSWPASFGEGRPGWHIECSAMSMKYLGATFDIHGGGVDLIFPHHENEIAQAQAATGKPLAKFFLEGEHLLVEGEKMSKSLGNVVTLRDIETKGFNPLTFRYLVLTSHYRSKLNFTWESLAASQHSLERLYETVRVLKQEKKKKALSRKKNDLAAYQKKFEKALFDDLNTSRAVAIFWDIIHRYHKMPARYDAQALLRLFYRFDEILGLGLKNIELDTIPPMILEFVDEREVWRRTKDWAKADELRKKIEEAGYTVEDTPEGPRVMRVSQKK